MRTLRAVPALISGALLVVVLAGCGSTGTSPAPLPSGDLPASGTRIVYSAGPDVCTMNPDGSGVKNLTAGSGLGNRWPTWSPDGTRIAFLRGPWEPNGTASRRVHPSSGGPDYYVMKADGTQLRRVTHHPTWNMDGTASWSPDGTKLVFSADPTNGGTWHLYIINTDGSGLTQFPAGGSRDVAPSWSPDGRTIVFSSLRSGSFQIWTIKPDGSDRTRLTHYALWDYAPRWSPDGAQIVFTRDFGGNHPEVCSMDADGTHIQRLTHDSAYDASPTWSPTGASIAFWRTNSGICVMKANGTGAKPVMSGGQAPSWQHKG